jgi:hypothetical protein
MESVALEQIDDRIEYTDENLDLAKHVQVGCGWVCIRPRSK